MHRRKAFTLVELIAAIAIVAILVAVMVPTVGNFVQKSRQTADRQTLAVLNDAINRYKMHGGDVGALAPNIKKGDLISLLSTPVSWHGVTHQFMRGGSTIGGGSTIAAAGSGASFRLTQYGSYEEEAGGTEVTNNFDTTAIVAWYDFNDASAAVGGMDLTEVGTPTYTSGYGTADKASTSGWQQTSVVPAWWNDPSQSVSMVIRFRSKPTQVVFDRILGNPDSSLSIQRKTYWSIGFGVYTDPGNTNDKHDDQWDLIYLDYDASEGIGRVDFNAGAFQKTTSYAASAPNSSLTVGGSSSSSFTDVDISLLAFFNRPLTTSEISQLYNGGSDIEFGDL